MGLLERVQGKRGVWQLAKQNKGGLHEALEGVSVVAYSTEAALIKEKVNASELITNIYLMRI